MTDGRADRVDLLLWLVHEPGCAEARRLRSRAVRSGPASTSASSPSPPWSAPTSIASTASWPAARASNCAACTRRIGWEPTCPNRSWSKPSTASGGRRFATSPRRANLDRPATTTSTGSLDRPGNTAFLPGTSPAWRASCQAHRDRERSRDSVPCPLRHSSGGTCGTRETKDEDCRTKSLGRRWCDF